jgi:adenylate kinase family enzyme
MSEKIILLSISKYPYRSEFGFPKEQKFFDILRKFLWKLGFEEEDINISGHGRPWSEGEPISDKEDNIKKYINKIYNFNNKNYSVDIIYFDKEIYLIINSKQNKQKIISKALDEFIDWRHTK